MKNLYIDIETIPSQLDWIKDDIASKIKAPAQYKKQESIEKWLIENGGAEAEKQWLKTSFDGSLGEIVCVSYAIDDDMPKTFYRGLGDSEFDVLKDLFGSLADDLYVDREEYEILQKAQWVGHNVLDFDIRFLWQRCVINNVDTKGIPIPLDARHGSDYVFDTLKAWKGWGAKTGGSMNQLCKLFGIEDKGDMDGSKVWPAMQNGEHEKVARYCEEDVIRTREIYKKMTNVRTR